MSELAKKTAAIASAKRAKIICKVSRWEWQKAGDHYSLGHF
jgi:hypothetical protein